ncbi:MAG TPA: VOC family protein [Polyangiaceae bacterium]|jgi:lactoylglutathione lyase|nr:VOC family protein [Polyangiaceae bacterium]
MASATPKLKYIILYVEDLDRAVGFYQKAFQLEEKMRQGPYAEMNTGAVTLGLVTRDFVGEHTGIKLPAGGGASEIAFVVSEAAVPKQFEAALAAGGTSVLKPRKQPWGQLVSYVRDPDGHLVEICSPTD